MDKACSTSRGNGNAHGVLVGKAEGKRLLLKPTHG
jgi:hypothetical protein